MKLEAWKDVKDVVVYTMMYSEFNQENLSGNTWSSAIWELLSRKATFSTSICSVEVLQTGKNENGLYENYVKLVVPKDSTIDWDDNLTWWGYGYEKYETTMSTFYVEFGEAGLTYDCEVAIEVE